MNQLIFRTEKHLKITVCISVLWKMSWQKMAQNGHKTAICQSVLNRNSLLVIPVKSVMEYPTSRQKHLNLKCPELWPKNRRIYLLYYSGVQNCLLLLLWIMKIWNHSYIDLWNVQAIRFNLALIACTFSKLYV